ncbi:MAG: diacylglycerol kinase [Alicyclobacillus sp.]|nr:diacylglycerol kinase [Alicyclobacillus sp.]
MNRADVQTARSRGDRPPWLAAFTFAILGLSYAIATERNMRVHVCAAVAVCVFDLVVRPPLHLVVLSLLVCALVLASELWNTALERLADLAGGGKQHPVVGVVKDLGAAAVLVTAGGALVVGCYVAVATYPWRFRLMTGTNGVGAALAALTLLGLVCLVVHAWRMRHTYRR